MLSHWSPGHRKANKQKQLSKQQNDKYKCYQSVLWSSFCTCHFCHKTLARVAGVPFRAREKSTSPSRPKPPTDLSCARKGTPATQARKSIIHTQARPSETFSKRWRGFHTDREFLSRTSAPSLFYYISMHFDLLPPHPHIPSFAYIDFFPSIVTHIQSHALKVSRAQVSVYRSNNVTSAAASRRWTWALCRHSRRGRWYDTTTPSSRVTWRWSDRRSTCGC